MEFENDYKVAYAGRFQPFTPNHKKVYDHLVEKFGEEHVYITTASIPKSAKGQEDRYPLEFKDKVKVITGLYDIPEENIVEEVSPYMANNLVDGNFDQSIIYAVGGKDEGRFDDSDSHLYISDGDVIELPISEFTYVYETPFFEEEDEDRVSGTTVRDAFTHLEGQELEDFFVDTYGEMNQEVFDIFVDKISDQKLALDECYLYGIRNLL